MPRSDQLTTMAPIPAPLPVSQQGGTETPSEDHLPSELDRDEQIRKAAYAKYEARGNASGSAEQDWLEAESEYRAPDTTPLPKKK